MWGKCLTFTFHRVGLATSSLSVSENADVVAIDGRLHQLADLIEHLILGGVGSEDAVERELVLAAASAGRHRTFVQSGVGRSLEHLHGSLVEEVEMGQFPVARHFVRRNYGAHSAKHSDVALQLLDRVVQLPAKGLFVTKTILEISFTKKNVIKLRILIKVCEFV